MPVDIPHAAPNVALSGATPEAPEME